MNSKLDTYWRLELIPHTVTSTQFCQFPLLFRWLGHFCRRIKTPSPQAAIPFVWRSKDATGNIWWNVFDRLTGQTTLRMSNEQFLGWLERRYTHSL
ncbi:hypothetical protein [Thermocoleostomius sinensis]|uniref:Uncharacterized protein n=1 Tax=Thermocoleostomius sinensis A174 TaxID=2016057 RepID=A0A9E9C912_9CYAN|nr:hypothetical protein [Thermocoleostomius sinensis]WAL60888.1 hypothetical protein OXH18_02505 [Thermocoleostomius sinensis A174]